MNIRPANDAHTPNDAEKAPQRYVVYLVNQMPRGALQVVFSKHSLGTQEKAVQDFLHQHNGIPTKTFIESTDSHRHRQRWPALEEAVTYCLKSRSHLLIAEIKNLTNNENFTKQILRLLGKERDQSDISAEEFTGHIFCCDQPYITNENFLALVEHAKQQKKLHAQLIKAGLSRTNAKSGNPHASEIISKVNKPKIDNAITFALMLQPVIREYQTRGYSQRQMVKALNDEGFLAPEGGHWVLSQLQKVLERIKLNEAALSLEKSFLEYQARNYDKTTIANTLNKLSVPCPKGKEWTEEEVEKVSERIGQIYDIIRFNEFIIELMPIIEKYHLTDFTEEAFIQELQSAGITFPQQTPFQERTLR